MRRAILVALSAAFVAAISGNAMAFQTGKIYVSKEGEWMCIDRWGNEIPASSSGGWTVVTPPRKVGGDCNNRYVVRTGTTFGVKADLALPLIEGPLGAPAKGITEKGIK